MNVFKVGDIVERLSAGGDSGMFKVGTRGTIVGVDNCGYYNIRPEGSTSIEPGCSGRYMCIVMRPESYEETITIKNKQMSIIQKFVAAFTPEPQKTYIKAGLMNQDGTLTPDGVLLYVTYLLKKDDQMVFKKEVVDALVAKEE